MPAVALPPTPPVLVLAPYQSAEWILQQLAPRGRVLGMTRGQISLTDFVIAAAQKAGRADVLIAVYGFETDDIARLQIQRENGVIRRLRVIVPPVSRADEADYALLRATVGAGNVIESAMHMKTAVVQGDGWSIAIRGSVNLYTHQVAQHFDIDDDEALCAEMLRYAEDPQRKLAYPKPATEPTLAQAMLAPFQSHGRVFGIARGVSLFSMLRAILERTGPARVAAVVSAIGVREMEALSTLPEVRIVIGRGVAELPKSTGFRPCALFGDRLRVARTHAKFVTIRNDAWNIVVRTSANFTASLGAEQYDICDDAMVADHADAWIDFIFAETPPGSVFPAVVNRVYERSLLRLLHGAPPPLDVTTSALDMAALLAPPKPYSPETMAALMAPPAQLSLY